MKVRPSIWSITWRYLVVAIIIIAILFGLFFSFFIGVDKETGTPYLLPWGVSQILLVVLIGTAFIAIYIASILFYYYIIEDKYFTIVRYGKQLSFDYRNIEFIDIETSKRKNQVIFYSPKAKTRYLLGDKDGKLLETLIKKCPKTMSVEEFRRRHPEERY